MEKMKFGVLGVSGHFLKRIVLPLMESETVEIYAIASRNIDHAKEIAVKYGIPKYYGSYGDMLNDSDVDAIFNPLPNHIHKEWIYKSVDAGKHMLCEKPIAMNASETEEIINYVKGSDLSVMEAFMIRFHPKWQKAKSLIDNGYIGKISHIHTVFSYNNQDPANIRNILKTGGGALLDIGCYAINTARYIIGRAPNRVISMIDRHPEFGTDMTTSAILDYGDVRSLFTVSTAVFPQQRVKIFGTEGTVTVTIPFNDISEIPGKILFENGETSIEIEVEPVNQYRLMFESFAKSIVTNTDVPLPLSDSLNNMKTIDAVFESAKTENWVKID